MEVWLLERSIDIVLSDTYKGICQNHAADVSAIKPRKRMHREYSYPCIISACYGGNGSHNGSYSDICNSCRHINCVINIMNIHDQA